jgi:hypothetical protein
VGVTPQVWPKVKMGCDLVNLVGGFKHDWIIFHFEKWDVILPIA